MCEILVKLVSAVHADPIIDQRGCYKRGMPVVVMPDGHPWGLAERPPKFCVLRLPGIPADRVAKYTEQQSTGGSTVTRRRRWIVRIDDMPPAQQNRINLAGALSIGDAVEHDMTWSQARRFFRNQETGLDEDGELLAAQAARTMRL